MKLPFNALPRSTPPRNRFGPVQVPEATWYWNWTGASIGYRQGTGLFSARGREIGRFAGNEVYGPDGHYLCEAGLHGEESERLVCNRYKASKTAWRFTPTAGRSRPDREKRHPLELYVGQDDFVPQAARAATAGAS